MSTSIHGVGRTMSQASVEYSLGYDLFRSGKALPLNAGRSMVSGYKKARKDALKWMEEYNNSIDLRARYGLN